MSSLAPVAQHDSRRRTLVVSVLHCTGSSILVLMLTFLAQRASLNLAATGFLQLLIVLLVAIYGGFWPATFVATFAVACLDFLLVPPLYTFRIDDPQNWLALGVFETCALVVSRLSAQIQRESARASLRERELETIYRFSRDLLAVAPKDWPGVEIAELIRRSFRCSGVVVLDTLTSQCGSAGEDTAELERATRALLLPNADDPGRGPFQTRLLRVADRSLGVIGVSAAELSPVTVSSIASLTAIAMERVRSMQSESQIEAERRSDKLRTAILDALAHEYKTPLTAILTASSGLIEIGSLLPYQTELVSLIESEASRLSTLTTRLLRMSRLDSANIHGAPQRIDPEELIQTVLEGLDRRLQGHPVHFEGLESGDCIRADLEFVTIVLSQLLENAANYSAPNSPITIGVQRFRDKIHIHIHNFGAYIAPDEREKIFERFYRGAEAGRYGQGTGIGLSISRKLAEACGGHVWLTSDQSAGNTFYLSLPADEAARNETSG